MGQATIANEHAPMATPPLILIADPDDDNRAMYHETLRAAGYAVTEASDGQAALTEALMRRPALVLMELRLPLVDGYGLCEVLRREPETRSVPILVVTAEARARELARIRDAGANAVLVKPAVPDAVLCEVERWLSHARGTFQYRQRTRKVRRVDEAVRKTHIG
jgi:CheY-like chemotaxis protein